MGLGEFTNQGTWLWLLKEQAEDRGLSVNLSPTDSRADFVIEDCVVGKQRRTDASNRSEPRIWLRFDKELDMISDYPNMKVYSVVLDIHSQGGGFDPETDHFIPVTQEMLLNDTYGDSGDRDFDVLGDGKYESPFGDVADRWDVLFQPC